VLQAPTNVIFLIAEYDLELRGYLEAAVKRLGYSAEQAQDGEDILDRLGASPSGYAAVLIDLSLPNHDGLNTLRAIRRIDTHIPVIVLSGSASPMNIVTVMKSGGTDFLPKPVSPEDLRKALTRALEIWGVDAALPPSAASPTHTFVGRDPRMNAIYALAGQIGWSEAPVLIQGETGSGKEVMARQLHARSPRQNKPFLKLNCAALPSELVESELFGYERGAFTGAFQRKSGMFEMVDGGTILLDEIGDMDVRLQAKLLQVLQDHEFQRVGGKDTIRVDVRVIAATHRDLEEAIAQRSFREDLYYRLNVINIVLPPLRERSEDIIPLAEHLLEKHTPAGARLPALGKELQEAMLAYPWPGNVRELENVVQRFLILKDAAPVVRELRMKATRKPASSAAVPDIVSNPPSEASILEQVTMAKQQAETDAILAALSTTRWNRKRAAKLLQIDYKALLYLMKKLGIDEKPLRGARSSAAPHKVMAAGE
jgi:two-component system response regulator AtoC